jgi:para-nitrobenzyl esterase
MHKQLLALITWVLFAVPAAAQGPAPQVTIAQGSLSGVTDEGMAVFKDIPFAAPPVGPLRWRAPQAAPSWTEMRDATRFGPICPQAAQEPGSFLQETHPQSEDCLTLNVWSPNLSPGTKLPVMVWIYGGSFRIGGSALSIYDGTELAQHNVVVVTLNYRLGWLGFLDLPALAAEHPDEPHGNYGLMDQIAALKWVQANIASFGGDPSNVTIFGESAGGMSVNDLVASPLARGLFAKAISQSGLGLNHIPTESEAQHASESLATTFGTDTLSGADQLARLRALSPEQIRKQGSPTGPMVDGTVLTNQVTASFMAGNIAKVPYLAGSNSDEATLMKAIGMTPEKLLAPLGDRLAAVRAIYDADGKLDDDAFVRQFFGDALFASGAEGLAHAIARSGAPAYVYNFRYVADPLRSRDKGVGHGGEVPYVFGLHGLSQIPRGALLASVLTDKDKAVIAMMQNYWTNFAKTGDPNSMGQPQWTATNDAHPMTLVVDDITKSIEDFRKNQLAVIYAGLSPSGTH